MRLGIGYDETWNSVQILAAALEKKPKARKYLSITSLIGVVLCIIGFFINDLYFNKSENISIVLLIVSVFSFFLLTVCVASYTGIRENPLSKYLENLTEERQELTKKIKEDNNILDVIRINLNQLNEYYTINKLQAKRSYSFSIAMIVIGFIMLILAIMFWFFGKIGLNITIIATLAGLIAEFIGATSLLLYKESTKQIQLFFDKLSYLQHTMLAIELTERLNEEKKEEQIAVIISSLIEKK